MNDDGTLSAHIGVIELKIADAVGIVGIYDEKAIGWQNSVKTKVILSACRDVIRE